MSALACSFGKYRAVHYGCTEEYKAWRMVRCLLPPKTSHPPSVTPSATTVNEGIFYCHVYYSKSFLARVHVSTFFPQQVSTQKSGRLLKYTFYSHLPRLKISLRAYTQFILHFYWRLHCPLWPSTTPNSFLTQDMCIWYSFSLNLFFLFIKRHPQQSAQENRKWGKVFV